MSKLRTARHAGSVDLKWSLAGPDAALAAAVEELAAGNFIAAADLLRESAFVGLDTDLRCHRLMLMAQSATGTGAAERWITEHPDDYNAWALLARVAVLRAVRAWQQGEPQARQLADRARAVCDEASARTYWDTVPGVARLQLAAAVPVDQEPRTGKLLYEDPIPLLVAVRERHRLSREGHFRFLAAVGPATGGTVGRVIENVQEIMPHVPEGSVLHLLPLLMHLTSFRARAAKGTKDRLVAADREWSTYAAKYPIERAYRRWFASGQRHPDVLLPDLHLLAHALWRADMFAEAAQVFAEIGPWALPMPWNEHGEPGRIFRRARDRCVNPPG